ncbi:arginyl-tRNA synthetase [human gut metagenome]|uniref:Arginyl-tRNA synthetase n=1 Tax=human gut metagenome TaxID=408170 RepID=K1UAE5_9ZZZZ
MPEDVYKGVDIIEHAYNFYKINGGKFVNADEESRKSALVEYALPLNIDGLEKDLAKYRYRIRYLVQRKLASQERCGKADC